MEAPSDNVFTPEWCTHHFDHLSPALGEEIYTAFEYLRGECPVAHSDQYGGFWLVTRYEDVLRVSQDWETFSSAEGVTVPMPPIDVPIIPEMIDPPLHREYKRLINAWLTPSIVHQYEQGVRDAITSLIDSVIEAGECEFMEAIARPFPGMVFFGLVLHAPPEQLPEITRLTTIGSISTTPGAPEARLAILRWIGDLVEQRRHEERRADIVDAVINAEIDGRPINETEILAILQLLVFGGLDTTAGALGQMMIRFCRQPEIPALLRDRPELLPAAVEELLRLDGPLAYLARTATRDTEISGQPIKKGDKLLVSWMSANRDGDEFDDPTGFDLDRPANRHVAFGVGPHRCAGSNLARLNLRVAIGEIVDRLHDVRLRDGDSPVHFHPGFSRAPADLPITFRAGDRKGAAVG